MIIWTGRGIVAGIIMSFSYMFFSMLGVNDDNLASAYGLLLAAPITYIVGRYWNAPKPAIDPNTGEEVMWKPNHTLFWIPMQYWGVIFLVIGLIVIMTD